MKGPPRADGKGKELGLESGHPDPSPSAESEDSEKLTNKNKNPVDRQQYGSDQRERGWEKIEEGWGVNGDKGRPDLDGEHK